MGSNVEKIKVSIVVPFYDALPYLKETMECICHQSYSNLEIICVNDGSSDGGDDFIKRLAQDDQRIVLIDIPHKNAGTARNEGLEKASGEYIIFFDADDLYDKEYVKSMLTAITDKKADVAVCMSEGLNSETGEVVDIEGGLNITLLQKKNVFCSRDIPESIFQLTAGWAWDKIFRRDFLIEKNIRFQSIKVANDAFFSDTAMILANTIAVVRKVLVKHRIKVSTSIEATRAKWWGCGFEMLRAEKKMLEENGFFESYERSFINRAAKYIVWNACSITEWQLFNDFYRWFHYNGEIEFGFSKYEREYFYDDFYYSILKMMKVLQVEEFLCKRVELLNEEVEIRDKEIAVRDDYISELNKYIKNYEKIVKKKRWCIPEIERLYGKIVVVYGYGDVGKDFVYELRHIKNIKLEMIVDKDFQKYQTSEEDIHSVEDITSIEFDYIIIAVYRKKTIKAIKSSLIKMGVEASSIIDANFRCIS